jgi:hypothetical protein
LGALNKDVSDPAATRPGERHTAPSPFASPLDPKAPCGDSGSDGPGNRGCQGLQACLLGGLARLVSAGAFFFEIVARH